MLPIALFLLLLLTAPVAGAAEPQLAIVSNAAFEPVFLHARDACDRTDVPDIAARAWRTADGQAHLIASYSTNRRMNGPDLDHVATSCGVVFQASGTREPDAYDDRSWLSAPYTLDGRAVFALVSSEFHGQLRPDLCPAAKYELCWRNAIALATSTDGGATFALKPPAERLVAGVPYRYRGDVGRRTGVFSPSNIVARDGFYYAFVWAEALDAQRRGACLIRTARLDDPKSWRGFDGRDFTVQFVDAYRDKIDDPAKHACAPIAPAMLSSTVRNIVRDTATGRYIAMMSMERAPGPGAAPIVGIWWSSSPDLVAWSEPQLLIKLPLLTHPDCAVKAAYYYPALIDPKSGGLNFETVGARAYLYLTRLNLTNCRVDWDRDLVRIAVDVKARN